MAVQAVSSYRESMKKRAGTGVLEAWYSRLALEDVRAVAGSDTEWLGRIKKVVGEAGKQTQEHVFNKLTTPAKGQPRIVNQPPLLYHVDKRELNEHMITAFFKRYRETLAQERRILFDRFKVVDVAIKVVGIGLGKLRVGP